MRAHHTHNLYSIGDIYTTKQTITKYGYGLPRRWYLRHSRHQLFVSMVVLYICAILPINKSLVCNRFVRFFAYHAIAWQLQQLLLWAMLLLLLVCNVASRTFHCLLPHLILFRFSIHIQMQFFFLLFSRISHSLMFVNVRAHENVFISLSHSLSSRQRRRNSVWIYSLNLLLITLCSGRAQPLAGKWYSNTAMSAASSAVIMIISRMWFTNLDRPKSEWFMISNLGQKKQSEKEKRNAM